MVSLLVKGLPELNLQWQTAVSDSQTQISFIVRAEGVGISPIGHIFAVAYNANLDCAIPNLIAESAKLRKGTDPSTRSGK